jgi:hypothetical protein
MHEAEQRAEAAREAQESMSGMPFRFFCGVGETRELIVVDEKPDFFRYEHNLPDRDGRWKIFTSCINEYANCPICHTGNKQPYFAMYLTVIDLTPYTNKQGEEVPWSKKLLVVKPAQQKKIMRKLDQHGSLRGAVLSMSRDGDKDASIGNDIELVEFLEEDQLLEYETSYVNQKNEQIDVIGHEPFDYDELFPEQTEEQLAAIAGGNHNSYDDHARNVGASGNRRPAPGRQGAAPRGRSGDGWDQGAERRPAARNAAPARRPAARNEEPEGEPEGEPEEEAPAPRRGAPVRQAPAPAGRPGNRPAPRQVSRQAEPEGEGDDGYDDPPQRPAARGAAPARRPADAAPPSLASRRAALRGNRG